MFGSSIHCGSFPDLNAWAKPKRQEHLEAILADGLHVGGDMFFSFEKSSNTEVVVRGAVSLISTEVGGDLYLEGNFDFAGEDAVSADGIIVAGTTFRNGLRTNGIVRFVQGDLKQGLYIDGAKFDAGGNYRNWSEDENSAVHDLGGPSCGIYAPDAKVGETFVWKKIEKISGAPTTTRFWLYLSGSRTSVIEDDERSWRELDRFDVTGCEYGSISDLNEDIRWRLAVLDRQYAVLNGNLLHNLAFGCTLIGTRFVVIPAHFQLFRRPENASNRSHTSSLQRSCAEPGMRTLLTPCLLSSSVIGHGTAILGPFVSWAGGGSIFRCDMASRLFDRC